MKSAISFRWLRSIALVCLLIGVSAACTSATPPATLEPVSGYTEIPIQRIPLMGDAALTEQEYSGLDWYSDTLVLLPQYPADHLYGISKQTLLAFLAGDISSIEPFAIPFDAGNIRIPRFQGYEAIAFDGEQVYLTVEAGFINSMTSYLIPGTVAEDGSIHMRGSEPVEIQQPVEIFNASHEALAVADEYLLAIYERNGQHDTDNPSAQLIAPDFSADILRMPQLPYRITDASEMDSDGRFWVINYLYPGETAPDEQDPYPLYNNLNTHALYPHIERLLEMQLTSDHSLRITDTRPLYLQLENLPRNWEGIARLDQRGLLLITDKHPETILAFVPFPSLP